MRPIQRTGSSPPHIPAPSARDGRRGRLPQGGPEWREAVLTSRPSGVAMSSSCSRKGSRRAADNPCEGRQGQRETIEDRDAEPRGIPLLSWAFTTIRHGLLPSALTRGRRGADRGRQSANPRSPGSREPSPVTRLPMLTSSPWTLPHGNMRAAAAPALCGGQGGVISGTAGW
jgi:hypothetical protein